MVRRGRGGKVKRLERRITRQGVEAVKLETLLQLRIKMMGEENLISLFQSEEEMAALVGKSKRRLEELRGEFETVAANLTAEITARVTNEIGARVLLLRYIAGWEFSEIARRLGYSVTNIYRLHKKACAEFYGAGNSAKIFETV